MKLKSLELQGFKSFPDKTVLSFTGCGVTAILGPNGSGKSNVSDAVRWVLGELSSKNIRGTKMEDVIFGGSDTRRPMGYAEVTLVIDNREGEGRLSSDYDEVTVTRRYFRSGNSEYLINRAPVRLRDINELFMNTGIGRAGYSIIGQGKIAEIISQRSEDRRHIFEEAAGIAKYRYQKQEAEKKLAEVDENSTRLSDILTELSRRVRQLEKDSEKAKIYLDIYEQKKKADVSLWLYDVELLKKRSEETQRKFAASKLELENADTENENLERKNQALYDASQAGKLREDELNDKIDDFRNRGRDLESSSLVLENDIKHIDEQINRTADDENLKSQALETAKAQAAELETRLEEQKASLANARQNIAALREAVRLTEGEMGLLTQKLEQNEADIRQKNTAITELRVRISALEGSHETDSGRVSGAQDELCQLHSEIALFTDRIGRAQKIIASYTEKIDGENALSSEKTAKISDMQRQAAEIRERISRLQLDISGKKQKADTLRRMDELLEGYAQSVRFVMKAAESGRLTGICGPVSRLISVEPKVSVAVETALGANIQNIVVENEAAAKAAIALLKQNNAGRSTFYPITAIRPQPMNVPENELSHHKGYIGIASNLCRCDDKYSGIISYMLGRTAVFDNIDNAADTARALSYRVRIVTLDGQLINAGGSFTGGSVRQGSGMLTRSSDIKKLQADTEKLNRSLQEENRTASSLQSGIAELTEEISAHSAQLNLLNSLRQAESTQLEVLRTQCAADEKRASALQSDLDALGKQREHYGAELEGLKAHLADAERTLSDAETVGKSLNRAYSEADDRLAAQNGELNALLLSETGLVKDVESAEASRSLNRETQISLAEQLSKDRELRNSLLAQKKDREEQIRVNNQSAGTIDIDIRELENELSAVLTENTETERKQNLLREEIKEKARKRELLFREYTRLEAETAQLQSDTDRMTARMWDDYELTYGTAQALGYPSVTAANRSEINTQRETLRLKLKQLGSVNASAIEEYQTEKERFDFTDTQFRDLSAAREELSGVIERLEKEMKEKFTSAITEINKNFQVIFRELFGGGNAEITLSDPDNLLDCGIDINAAPPGKIIKNMTLMSGGEQSFTAIALIFAILNVNPTPFCIFDEIEAALDEVNVSHFAEYMKRYCDKTQFIVITHRRGTMEAADMIYGVSMPERGISRVLALNVNEVEQKIGVKLK